jgi:hypothetical protein
VKLSERCKSSDHSWPSTSSSGTWASSLLSECHSSHTPLTTAWQAALLDRRCVALPGRFVIDLVSTFANSCHIVRWGAVHSLGCLISYLFQLNRSVWQATCICKQCLGQQRAHVLTHTISLPLVSGTVPSTIGTSATCERRSTLSIALKTAGSAPRGTTPCTRSSRLVCR